MGGGNHEALEGANEGVSRPEATQTCTMPLHQKEMSSLDRATEEGVWWDSREVDGANVGRGLRMTV